MAKLAMFSILLVITLAQAQNQGLRRNPSLNQFNIPNDIRNALLPGNVFRDNRGQMVNRPVLNPRHVQTRQNTGRRSYLQSIRRRLNRFPVRQVPLTSVDRNPMPYPDQQERRTYMDSLRHRFNGLNRQQKAHGKPIMTKTGGPSLQDKTYLPSSQSKTITIRDPVKGDPKYIGDKMIPPHVPKNINAAAAQKGGYADGSPLLLPDHLIPNTEYIGDKILPPHIPKNINAAAAQKGGYADGSSPLLPVNKGQEYVGDKVLPLGPKNVNAAAAQKGGYVDGSPDMLLPGDVYPGQEFTGDSGLGQLLLPYHMIPNTEYIGEKNLPPHVPKNSNAAAAQKGGYVDGSPDMLLPGDVYPGQQFTGDSGLGQLLWPDHMTPNTEYIGDKVIPPHVPKNKNYVGDNVLPFGLKNINAVAAQKGGYTDGHSVVLPDSAHKGLENTKNKATHVGPKNINAVAAQKGGYADGSPLILPDHIIPNTEYIGDKILPPHIPKNINAAAAQKGGYADGSSPLLPVNKGQEYVGDKVLPLGPKNVNAAAAQKGGYVGGSPDLLLPGHVYPGQEFIGDSGPGHEFVEGNGHPHNINRVAAEQGGYPDGSSLSATNFVSQDPGMADRSYASPMIMTDEGANFIDGFPSHQTEAFAPEYVEPKPKGKDVLPLTVVDPTQSLLVDKSHGAEEYVSDQHLLHSNDFSAGNPIFNSNDPLFFDQNQMNTGHVDSDMGPVALMIDGLIEGLSPTQSPTNNNFISDPSNGNSQFPPQMLDPRFMNMPDFNSNADNSQMFPEYIENADFPEMLQAPHDQQNSPQLLDPSLFIQDPKMNPTLKDKLNKKPKIGGFLDTPPLPPTFPSPFEAKAAAVKVDFVPSLNFQKQISVNGPIQDDHLSQFVDSQSSMNGIATADVHPVHEKQKIITPKAVDSDQPYPESKKGIVLEASLLMPNTEKFAPLVSSSGGKTVGQLVQEHEHRLQQDIPVPKPLGKPKRVKSLFSFGGPSDLNKVILKTVENVNKNTNKLNMDRYQKEKEQLEKERKQQRFYKNLRNFGK